MKTILLHGLGQNNKSWDEVKKILEKENEVEVPNLFQLVNSPVTYDTLFKKFEDYCNEQDTKINLCGLSMGGILALDYASRYPDKIHSVVLIAIPYSIPKEIMEKQNEMFEQMPEEAFIRLGLAKNDFILLVKTMNEVDVVSKIDKLKSKCLVVCGEQDSVNIESAKTIHEKINGSFLSLISNSGHEINKDNPIELGHEILKFLRMC